MKDINVTGKNFIAIMRVSKKKKKEVPFSQQRMTIERCAKEYKVNVIDWVPLNGFSATKGQQVNKIQEFIDKKIAGAQFDGFILDAYSRFSRSGVDEANLWSQCCDADLLILCDKQGLMMGPGSWAKRGSAVDQSEGYAADVGRHISRAVIEKIIAGIIPPTLTFPWGCDRQYYDKEHKTTFRMRRLTDGNTLVFKGDSETDAVMTVLRGNLLPDLLGETGYFRWVPSSKLLQDVSRTIFRMKYIDGVCDHQICSYLNTHGILTRNGHHWCVRTLRQITTNPIWIGNSVGFVNLTGYHGKRTVDGPEMFPMARRPGYDEDGQRRNNLLIEIRPEGEWIVQVQPAFVEFLDEDVRAILNVGWQERHRTKGITPEMRRGPKGKNKPRSSYFLTGLIKVTTDSCAMVGNNGNDYRYYCTPRQKNKPVKGRPIERIRAEIPELQFRIAMAEALQAIQLRHDDIQKYIEEKQAELRGVVDPTQDLRADKRKLERWYRETFSVGNAIGQELLKEDRALAEKRLEEIAFQLAELEGKRHALLKVDAAEIVESLKQQIREFPREANAETIEAMSDVAASLCRKMTFDPATRRLDIIIGLPKFIEDGASEGTPEFRTAGTSCASYSASPKSDFSVLSRVSGIVTNPKRKHVFVRDEPPTEMRMAA